MPAAEAKSFLARMFFRKERLSVLSNIWVSAWKKPPGQCIFRLLLLISGERTLYLTQMTVAFKDALRAWARCSVVEPKSMMMTSLSSTMEAAFWPMAILLLKLASLALAIS